jgi:hypothetical protein
MKVRVDNLFPSCYSHCKMASSNRVIKASLVLFSLLVALAWEFQFAAAQTQAPERRTTITVSYNQYEWWLIRWSDNEILCRILTDHEGLPTGHDVLVYCGNNLYTQWEQTPPCSLEQKKKQSTTACDGLYLHLVSFTPKEKEVKIVLPSPVAYVNLEGCTPQPPTNLCDKIPSLLITAEEPLPNEHITSIEGTYNGKPFSCDGAQCSLPLTPTSLQGVSVEFWAVSSFGDTTDHYTALVRVVDTGVSPAPGSSGWFVDVISSQWRGADLASCVSTWDAFPPVGGLPSWLSTPDDSALMSSDAPYYYLAGRLIQQGVVDASACSSGGLLPNGYADACGLDKARPQVEAWQNQFDARIVEVAHQTGVPAQLMKNLFAQESQFWPGVFRVPFEFGLGQITDNGAEAVLLWNNSFYEQFCPLVLTQSACDKGYLGLHSNDQAILRGALALQAKADCTSCEEGIDLTNVDFSLTLFAKTLKANCAQVGQIVTTATQSIPGAVSTYEDLWKFTIANYHAGPGCVAYAITSAWASNNSLTWDDVSQNFTDACRGVIPYVNKITQ